MHDGVLNEPVVTLLEGDWLQHAARFSAECVDLLYADLPFNTGATQRTPVNAHKRTSTTITTAYADAWPDMASYLAWLRARLEATLPALRPSGNILLHCDWRTSHHVRLLLDQLLSPENFVNHIIWQYGLGGSSPRMFARKHDDILLYCVDQRQAFFEAPRVPATSNRMKGQLKKATDVLAIPAINNMASERTGYPTQKPLALLDVLVRSCCPAGGTVLDPCCGSGTTLIAARAAGRSAIGIDTNPDAIACARRRLAT